MSRRQGIRGFEYEDSGGSVPGMPSYTSLPPSLSIPPQATTADSVTPSSTNIDTQSISKASSASPSRGPNEASSPGFTTGRTDTPKADSDVNAWDGMSTGSHAGIITAVLIGVFLITGLTL